MGLAGYRPHISTSRSCSFATPAWPYLNAPKSDASAWVTKAAAIRAGNWQKFRDWHDDLLAQVLDLSDARVFGGGDARRSCVLFEVRRSSLRSAADDAGRVLKAECPGATPDASSSLDEAQMRLRWIAPRRFPRGTVGLRGR